jgi:hypothetical protein
MEDWGKTAAFWRNQDRVLTLFWRLRTKEAGMLKADRIEGDDLREIEHNFALALCAVSSGLVYLLMRLRGM